MFEAVQAVGGEGVTELELVAAAEAVSRSEGFGGQVHMRRFPLSCDRGVIVAGRAGGIPSFFDSAVATNVGQTELARFRLPQRCPLPLLQG